MLEAYAPRRQRPHDDVDRRRPWSPIDSLLVHRVRHVLMGSVRSKLWRAVVRDVAGPDVLRIVDSESDDGLAVVDGGSNNWVVAGSRTASGLPLLAGDPHRELEVPNVYTQSHIACPEFDAIGVGFAGVPGFGHFGHTARVAWSITHGMLDDQDLFIERADGTPAANAASNSVEGRRARTRSRSRSWLPNTAR